MNIINMIPVLNEAGLEITRLLDTEFNSVIDYDSNFFEKKEGHLIVKNTFFLPAHQVISRTIRVENTTIKNEGQITTKVLLILESPHKAEFDEVFNPITIANGITGRNISNHVLRLLTKIDNESNTFDITIYNPVPFQTSLNYFTNQDSINSDTKNQFWFHCWWNMAYKEKLSKFSLDGKFKYFINACTKDLSHFVSDELKNVTSTIYKVSHPSSAAWVSDADNFHLKRVTYL